MSSNLKILSTFLNDFAINHLKKTVVMLANIQINFAIQCSFPVNKVSIPIFIHQLLYQNQYFSTILRNILL